MASSRKKVFTLGTAIIAIALLCCPHFLYAALPEVENVVEGTATFDYSEPNVLRINTTSDKLIVEYNSFSIAANESVYFTQPSVNSAALNRVVGSSASDIAGYLNANGIIYLINPNGINIGSSANINAASFIASTLNITNADFLSGKNNFFKSGENTFIINRGNISIRNGGFVFLLSQAVQNYGNISVEASLGTIVLASGEEMRILALDDAGDISVVIDKAVESLVFGPDGQKLDSAVKNAGTITANGGKVILTTKILNKVFDYAINNTGVIQATNVENHNGVIELSAEGAPIINSGTLKAGKIQVTAPGTEYYNIGKMIADGSADLPNGGLVNIQAGSILQKGLISANALENGVAGEIDIFSETSTVLDSGSSTEARALGIIGNGGRILIDSTGGNTLVNTNAVIDVSAGAISGNAGYIEVGAFEQLGFYGILNGRAPPGYTPATVKFTYHSPAAPPVIIITDQADYPPSGTPIISGSGFLPNQEITLNISNPDGTYTTLTAVTNSEGKFSVTYEPTSLLWGTYVVTSTDGARSAVTTFTDSNHIDTVAVGTQTGSPTYGTAGSATFPISFTSHGSGADLATLSVTSGLPTGASSSFYQNPVDVTGTSTLTITTSATTPAGTFTFTVQAVADATVTNTGTLTVNRKALTITGFASDNKVYNGNNTAVISNAGTLSGVESGDTVNFTNTGATFADKNVANGITVTLNGVTLTGGSNTNYSYSATTTDLSDITAKPLTITGITANNKEYDGNTTATLNTGAAALSGNIAGDAVTLDTTGAVGTFADKNVGNGKTVTVSGLTIGDADATNYSLTQPSTTADIVMPAFTESQLSNATIFRFLLPSSEQLVVYQINTFTGTFYLYHPLTPTDMSAFDEFILRDGDYSFLDGALNIVGHEGLLPFLK